MSVDVAAPPVTELGLKEAVTPDGVVALRVTDPVKRFCEVIVIVEVSELPTAILSELGDAEMVKSGGAVAVTVRV